MVMYCSEQFLLRFCLHDAILPNCPRIFAQDNANVAASCGVLYPLRKKKYRFNTNQLITHNYLYLTAQRNYRL